MIINVLWALLGSKSVRYALAGLLALAAAQTWLWRHDHKTESKVIAKVDASAKELTKEAIVAREPATLPGSVQRLRTNFCRDC